MAGYVGIDVGKAYLDAAAVGAGGAPGPAGRFANDAEGVEGLVAFAAGLGPALVAIEATGAYHRAALAALWGAGLPVSLVDPARARAFRQTERGRNKTDREDAKLLARFARTYADQLRRYEPPSAGRERLRALVRYREGLVKVRTQLLGRLEAARCGGDAEVAELLEARLGEVDAWIGEAEGRVGSALAGAPEAGVLVGIKGVGPGTAAAVLAYLPEAVLGDAKAAACYAGVHPSIEASGQSYASRMSKRGCPELRRYLYMAAMAAIRGEGEMRAYYLRLVGRGKAKKAALGAVMHKLLRRMVGRLREYHAAHPPQPA